jgi:putative DNA primase/helicase
VRSLRQIAERLGGEVSGRQVLCPGPGHSPRDRSLAVRFNGDHFVAHSFADQDWRVCRDYVADRLGIDKTETLVKDYAREMLGVPWQPGESAPIRRAPAPDLDQLQRIKRAASLASATVSLRETLGWRYFTEHRGLDIGRLGDLDHALRWHAGICAVVAVMTDPITNEQTGIHRTFLNADGTAVLNPDGTKKRMMLGKQGVIRLTRNEDVTSGLGIVEGIEDGLAVLLSGWAPVWAATSAGAIKAFPVLSGIEALTIFADQDDNATGFTAALACQARWTTADREVRIFPPKEKAK